MKSGLKDILRTWQSPGLPVRLLTFRPSKAVEAAKQVGEDTDRIIRPPLDLHLLRTKLITSLCNNDLSDLDVLDWRYSTLCLNGSAILANISLLQTYLDAVGHRARGRLLRGLARVYVDSITSFPQAATLLAAFLAPHAHNMGRRWAEPAERFHLFNPTKVVDYLADYLLRQDVIATHGVAAIFDQSGLPSGVAVSELGAKVFQKALQKGSEQGHRLNSLEIAQRIIDLASANQGGLFLQGIPSVVQALTDALLLPFQSSTAPEPIRSLVETYLLRQLRDPRLDGSLWHPVRPEAKAVMHSWLTEQSLELFLGIVDKVANKDENARRMWSMRGKFWRAYHRKKFIDQAWVVLGISGVREVKRIIAQTESSPGKTLSYAALTHSTDINNHIVLILKIDNLIVVDWSHNGRCHIWHEQNTSAPKLYKQLYSKRDLEFGSEEPGPYTHYANGSWRESIAKHIRNETGRFISANEYV